MIIPLDGADTVNGGDGADTDSYDANQYIHPGIVIDLFAGTANGGSGPDKLKDIENAIGTRGADTISGSLGANKIEGIAGDDDLEGAEGADEILGGTGDDLMAGGDGNDRAPAAPAQISSAATTAMTIYEATRTRTGLPAVTGQDTRAAIPMTPRPNARAAG